MSIVKRPINPAIPGREDTVGWSSLAFLTAVSVRVQSHTYDGKSE